jgi:superfamily I DNA and RNA helicase
MDFKLKPMKKLIASLVLVLSVSFLMAQNIANVESQTSWENVKVVYEAGEVADMQQGETLSSAINASLNFGTRAKFRKNCMEDLKKEAAEKGYSVILINEEASTEKRFNKRGFEITLVGKGYRS